jgi:hypothetical protein
MHQIGLKVLCIFMCKPNQRHLPELFNDSRNTTKKWMSPFGGNFKEDNE